MPNKERYYIVPAEWVEKGIETNVGADKGVYEEIQNQFPVISELSDRKIKTAGHKFVQKTTLYGAKNATIGAGARSYYETELRSFIGGCNWIQKIFFKKERVV